MTTTSNTNMEHNTKRLLINILAATDALWTPHRRPGNHDEATVLAERRKLYREAGVLWNSGRFAPWAKTEATRHGVTRLLRELGADGLICANNPTGLRTTTVKLTDAGEAIARDLIGTPTLADSLPLVEKIHAYRLHPDGADYLGRAWCPETHLAGIPWGHPDQQDVFGAVLDKLHPALVAGVLVAVCSVQGHCWYSLNPGQPEALRAEVAALPARQRPEPDEELLDAYWTGRIDNLHALHREKSDGREIGGIPMPVCPERRGSPITRAAAGAVATMRKGKR